jgi:hypothetical protein
MAAATTLDAGTGNIEITMADFSASSGSAGDIALENLVADHIILRHKSLDAGGNILQNFGVSITALSLFIDHDGPINGTVGTGNSPFNLTVDNVGAHIHGQTIDQGIGITGIFIDAQPNSASMVTVGNTCYGSGLALCSTFGVHGIVGLETVQGGGDISLNVTGDLFIVDQIQVEDTFTTGNPGNIFLTATGTIISNGNIVNLLSIGNIDFNTPSPVSFFNNSRLGINGGTVTLDGGTGSLLLSSGAFFEGVGTVDGDVNSLGGLIDIGDDNGNIGSLTITGDLTLDPNAILVFDIAGSAVAGTDYDQLNVSGSVLLGGDFVSLWDTQNVPGSGTTYTFINAAGGFSNNFANVIVPVGVTTSTPNVGPTTFTLTTDVVSPNIIFWANPAGGDWDIPTNWVGGIVPGNTDYVAINDASPVTITITTPVPAILGIEVQNALAFSGSGQLTINNTSISLIGDDLTLGSTGGLTANGTLYLASQTVLNSGLLDGTGDIVIPQIGSMTIAGGTMDNSARTVTANGVLNFNSGFIIGGAGESFFANNTVNQGGVGGTFNGGTFIQQAGNVYNATSLIGLQNGVQFTINGTLDFQSNFAGLNVSAGAATATINGTLIKSSAGTSTIGGSITFSAPGTIDVQAGILHVAVVGYNGGTTLLSGGVLNINSSSGTLTSSTLISGSGTIDGNVTLSGGTIQPGGSGTIGTIAINGDFTHFASASIDIDVLNNFGGPSIGYDVLTITGQAGFNNGPM